MPRRRPSPAGPSCTKAQYIASGDKICAATTDKLAAAATKLRESAQKSGELPVSKVTAFLTNTSLPADNAMLDDLRALTPPKDDEETVDGFIAALAGAIDTAKSDPVKYSRNGSPDPFDDFNTRVSDYGMTACGGS